MSHSRSARPLSGSVAGAHVQPPKQRRTNNDTQADETNPMTVFHNLCRDYHEITPHLDCARSGYLHTICSVVHKREYFIITTQTAVSTILGQVFTNRIDRAAVSPTTLAALAPESHTSSTSVCMFHVAPVPSAFAGFSLLQITPVPSGFHAVVRILDILHGVGARFF